MKEYILYHQIKIGIDCPDGIAAAWAIAQNSPSFKDRHPVDYLIGAVYGEPVTLPKNADKVYIVDFSLPIKILNEWTDRNVEVILIDHHKTAAEMLGGVGDFTKFFHRQIGKLSLTFDLNHSAAVLGWQQSTGEKTKVPAMLSYVEDRDLWRWKLPYSREVNEAMGHYRWKSRTKQELWSTYDRWSRLTAEQLIEELRPLGEQLLAPKRAEVDRLAATAHPIDHAGLKARGLVLNADGSANRLISDLSEKIYTTQDCQFTILLANDLKISFRSNNTSADGGFDVSKLAAELGGGGHRNAAGATIDMDRAISIFGRNRLIDAGHAL